MLIVEVVNGKIEKAIKQMRRKVNKTKQRNELRDRKEFTKKSVVNRLKMQKAKYREKKRREGNE